MYPTLFTSRVEMTARTLNAMLTLNREFADADIRQIRRLLDQLTDGEVRALYNQPCEKGGMCFKWNDAKAYDHYLPKQASVSGGRLFRDILHAITPMTTQRKNEKIIGELLNWRKRTATADLATPLLG